ncbi:MAG: hypothetical protein R2713_08415 [Ilumatobacteraceae bacterium]
MIVVGAGVAGLAAARARRRRTIRDRAGGDGAGGWTRAHRSQPRCAVRPRRQLDPRHRRQSGRRPRRSGRRPAVELDFSDVTAIDEGGDRWTLDEFGQAEQAYEELMAAVVDEGDDDVSVATMIASLEPDWFEHRLQAFFTSTYLVFDTGDLDRLSSALADEGEVFGGPEVVMTDGYDRIATHLAAGLDVRLGLPVTAVGR